MDDASQKNVAQDISVDSPGGKVTTIKNLKKELLAQGMDQSELVRKLIKCINGANTSVMKDGTIKAYYDAKIALRAIEIGLDIFSGKFSEEESIDINKSIELFKSEIKEISNEPRRFKPD